MSVTYSDVITAPRPATAEPVEQSVWQLYEREKRRIAADATSVAEYERRIKELVTRLGL